MVSLRGAGGDGDGEEFDWGVLRAIQAILASLYVFIYLYKSDKRLTPYTCVVLQFTRPLSTEGADPRGNLDG